jgi:hypothetical protein
MRARTAQECPRQWPAPVSADGNEAMVTEPLDVYCLLAEAGKPEFA